MVSPLFSRAAWLVPTLGLATNWAVQAQDTAQPALRYLQQHASEWRLQASDVAETVVTDSYVDTFSGITFTYLRQRYQGLEILGTESGLHFDRQGQLLARTGSFVANIAHHVPNTPANTLSALDAAQIAARQLNLTASNLRLGKTLGRGNRITLHDEALSSYEIPAQLAYKRQLDGSLKLVWQLVLNPPKTSHQWQIQIDAASGSVLSKTDLNTHESFVSPTATKASQQLQRAASKTAARAGTDGASYNVFAIPVEAPHVGERTLITNPADEQASPFGWHDVDGVKGPEYTFTRGNNVQAFYINNTTKTFAQGGASLKFDFPFDINNTPLQNRDAAVTNLFYVNNIMHDVFYHYGFREESGNFQTKNYTGKGKGGDAVFAQAQDPTGTDNAYFSTRPDGQLSEMHMFLFPAPIPLYVTVSTGGSTVGKYRASLGEAISPNISTGVTGELALVDDGSIDSTRACSGTLINAAAIKGKIAVVDRGGCTFVDKVKLAQNAGAIAVIIINNSPNGLFGIGGDQKLRIPSIAVTLDDGKAIKERLAAGQSVTASVAVGAKEYQDRDGDLDNGIVMHEYGHGISTRLTGGPNVANCLQYGEQMGEGWSDFIALWLTMKEGDKGATPRGMGNYVSGLNAEGLGIRNKRYSTDFSVNNYTYGIIGNPYDEEHDIGEVWATVLWDLNWAMIDRYGFSSDFYKGTAGNNKAMQLVMQGMKLQPCDPGFLDGRDAILAADRALYSGANQDLIWRVFARRGMGQDAVQGSSLDVKDNKAGFTIPAALATQNTLAATAVEVFPNPANDRLTLRTFGLGTAPVQVELCSLLGAVVQRQTLAAGEARQGTNLDLSSLANGIYLVRVTTAEGSLTKKVVVRH